jgi:PAS domain S-box-containing protein
MSNVPASRGEPELETPFTGPGEARRLARGVPWHETPLGPPEGWPTALRTIVRTALATPIPIAIWAGPELTLLHNDAYLPILGEKASWAMGRPGHEVWAEVWDTLGPELERVVTTGVAARYQDRPFLLRRSGRAETAYFTFTVAPVVADDGQTVAIFSPCEETTLLVTERLRAGNALGELAEKQAFLLRLSDALRPLRDADEIQYTAARLLGQHLGVSRALYSEIVDEKELVVTRDWADGVPALTGRYPLEVFGDEPPALLRRGNLIIDDLEQDDRLSPRARSAFRAMGAAASMIASLVKEGRWVATLGLHSAVPRTWTPLELSLLEEVTERTWATVERARAEAAARANEQTLQAFFDSASFLMGIAELDGDRILPVSGNRALVEFRAATPTGDGQLPPDIVRLWVEKYRESQRRRAPVRFEYQHPRPGAPVWLRQTVAFTGLGPGGKPRFSFVAEDVTERRRAEKAIRESRKQLAIVIDRLPVAAGLIDMRGRWVITNAALRAMTSREIPSNDLAQRPNWSALDEEGRPLPPEQWPGARALRGEVVSPGVEFTFRSSEGRELRTIVSAIPLRGPDGVQTGAISTFQDVTRLKLAEEELRLANRQKADFLAVLSHELRNPLAPIRNSLYLLARPGAGPDQVARALEVLDRQTRHLTRLVDDLLDVTRIERGKVELQRNRLDLRDVVRKTTDDLRSTFEQRGVTLRVQERTGPTWVDGDAVRLEQALANLLQNAAKFTPSGGTVTVSLSAADGQATLSVRDTGEGMDPEQIERMFEPFTQAAQGAARTRGGLGLGLALVKGFVELHGGTVRASSDGPGRGAEFVIELPTVEPPLPRDAEAAAAGAARDVVLIEDSADAARTLADVLQLQGHRVRIASDARTGLALVRERRPDLVLCDIGLPDMSGYDVARTLRAEASTAGIVLVALTGYAQPEDRRRAAEAGFDAHLAKPPSLERLEELLRTPPTGSSSHSPAPPS